MRAEQFAITGSVDRRAMKPTLGCRYQRRRCAELTCDGVRRNRRRAGNAMSSRAGKTGDTARGGRRRDFGREGAPNVSTKLNRRELLVAGGAVGAAAAAVSALGPNADAGVELGRYARREGVQGKMTVHRRRRPRSPVKEYGASLVFRGRRPTSCGMRSKPVQFPTFWSRMNLRLPSWPTPRRHRRGRRLLGRARSGVDQRADGDRRGDLRQHSSRRDCQ